MERIYNIYSEYDELRLVAKIHEDKNENLVTEVLVPYEYKYFPIDLLGVNRDWDVNNTNQNRRWLESRVIPRTRQFLDDMLEAVKLPEWDLVQLLKLNKGRVVDDKFYIEIEETI